MVWSWRNLYAYPVWHRSDMELAKHVLDHGREEAFDQILATTVVWRPYWRRRDGSLRLRAH